VTRHFYDNLPEYWKQRIAKENWFELSQFSNSIMIFLEDGGSCYFNNAFIVEDKERRELAVFTEHSGYYVFPRCDKGMSWTILKPLSQHGGDYPE
jgi:hypothetical protein